MDFELKFKSIAVRWFIEVFLIIFAIVFIAAIAFTFFFNTLYTERVETLGNDYSYEFSSLSGANKATFADAAVKLSDSFQHKNKMEVQVRDSTGRMIVSTTGFLPAEQLMTDYEQARTSDKGVGYYKGKNSEGERILACTTAIYNSSGEYLGAYRWITSMEVAHKRTVGAVIMVCGLGLLMLSFCLISGFFFIRSIVNPIRNVSTVARKIASGDFQTRLKIEKNDEIGELCDTINYMATELSQAETIKNDFISSVSHELRTPLTAIRGWGETAKMSLETDPELVARGLDVVLGEADRLSSLVEELLDFSRMQSGKLSVNMRPINVTDQLEVAVDMYTELARKQGIEISYTAPKHDSMVMGDPDRLKQVFINIIDNAVKYTEKGGLVLVMQTREEGCVRITVKDTGVGIPAQDLDRVKEKFFKSNKTVRGSGIGLAVADEIIRQHQGLIFVESTESVGTTVTIVIPLYEAEIQPEEATETVVTEIPASNQDIPAIDMDMTETINPQQEVETQEENI